MREEEHLFEEMKKNKDTFSSIQWGKSKEHFVKFVLKDVDNLSAKVVLHIGCGVDSFVSYFDDFFIYFSADITEEMLKNIDTKGAQNKFLIHCNVEALPFKQNSIDVILCIDLIHHFYSCGIDIPLREILRCLKPEGLFFLEEVNKYSLYRLLYSFFPLKAINILRGIKSLFQKNYSKPASYEAPLSIYTVTSALKNFIEK